MKKFLIRTMYGEEVYYSVTAEDKDYAVGKVERMLSSQLEKPDDIEIVTSSNHEHVHYVDNVEMK